MKKMNSKNFTKFGIVVGFSILTTGLLCSCGKKNNVTPALQSKTAKFTITVTGVNSKDVSTFSVNSTATDGSKSLWKINGVVQNDQVSAALSSNDFTGNTQTYVIESNTGLIGPIAADVSCLYLDHNYTVSFKAEINGVVKEDDENIVVTPTSNYSHDFVY